MNDQGKKQKENQNIEAQEENYQQQRSKGKQKMKIFSDEKINPIGRLWVFWKNIMVQVNILMVTTQVIHCQVKDMGSQFECCITFVYGKNKLHERKELYEQLRMIYRTMQESWLVIGDFNSVLSVNDRINGQPIHQTEIVNFQNCIKDIGMGQLNRKRCQWSWCNKRDTGERIYSNIDWVFGNASWFTKYSSLEAVYEVPGISDHSHIEINTEVTKLQRIQDIARLMNKEMNSLEKKIGKIRMELQNIQRQIDNDHLNQQLIEQEKEMIVQAEKWEEINEQVLRQKSRTAWIKSRNGHCLSKEKRKILSCKVTREDVDKAVKELPYETAPGIYGFTAKYFKEYWSTIGNKVRTSVLEFFSNGKLLKSVNCTTLTLIPKVANPNSVQEFRPIACCRIIYNIISRILTTKLKLVVESIVGESQSAFIEGRNILDDVIIHMRCYFLILNGGLTNGFQWKKGLRQGDPMSPYLFVLVMEYLNKALKKLKDNPNFNHHPRGIRFESQSGEKCSIYCRSNKGFQGDDTGRNAVYFRGITISISWCSTFFKKVISVVVYALDRKDNSSDKLLDN
ncbi:uncharacterized protein LOC142174238 [Nicotiana tabacum]|uniref:Uncharacterized protein LOC142174238 n=1 Tax=Nicotiana tabacum TaxID=4097 RepID=A0AC58TFX7_TOBAC